MAHQDNSEPSPRRTRLRNISGLVAFALVITTCAAFVGVYHVVPRGITAPPRKGQRLEPPKGARAVAFDIDEALTLRGWLRAVENPVGVVVMLHGIGGSKAQFVQRLEMAASQGWIGVAIDHRAHGDSGGDYGTYGFHEKHDLKHVVRKLRGMYPGLPVGVWGTSYGGAVALQAMGDEGLFDFGIVESTFARFDRVVLDYQARLTGLRWSWLADFVVMRAGEVAGFDPAQVAPEESAKAIAAPLLHVHGTADIHIPMDHARAIRAHLKPSTTVVLDIEGAVHHNVVVHGGTHYRAAVVAFLRARVAR